MQEGRNNKRKDTQKEGRGVACHTHLHWHVELHSVVDPYVMYQSVMLQFSVFHFSCSRKGRGGSWESKRRCVVVGAYPLPQLSVGAGEQRLVDARRVTALLVGVMLAECGETYYIMGED